MRSPLVALIALSVAGCYSTSDFMNGTLHCSPAGECPDEFSCVEGICWRGGIVVGGEDLAVSDAQASADGQPAVDGQAGSDGPQSSPDLAPIDCTVASCPDGSYCAADKTCQPQVATDGTCSADAECVTGSCVSGRCTWVALSWVSVPSFTWARYNAMAAALPFPDGRIFVMGGYASTADSQFYDVTTGAVTAGPAMPTTRYEGAAVASPNGKDVYVVAGRTPTALNGGSDVLLYNGTTGMWATGTLPIPGARLGHGCVLFSASSIACVGGGNLQTGTYPNDFESFTPGSGWSALAGNFPTWNATDVGVAILAGKVYVAGGYIADSGATNNVAVWSAGAWSTTAVPKLSARRNGLGLAAGPDGRLYAIAGGDDDDATARPLSSVEAYSPGPNRWVTLPTTVNVKRNGTTAVTGADGRIYLIGGYDSTSSTYASQVEAYGPVLKLSNSSPPRNSQQTITGTNLAPNAKVKVTFDGQDLATGTTDNFGGLDTITITVPNVATGSHRIVVVDNRSGYPITLNAMVP